ANADATHIEVIQASPVTGYIAISHVWADGLGNCRSNSLPSCQAKLLHQRVRAASPVPLKDGERMCFWIDTPCVPLRPNNERKSAIKQMRQVYAGASRVL